MAVAGTLAIVILLGVAMYAMGRSSASPAPRSASAAPPASVPGSSEACSVVEHSPEGAATTAASGLYELALANLGTPDSSPDRAKDIERILARYVVADQRPVMRQYLDSTQSTLTDIHEMPVAYQVVSYGDGAGGPGPTPPASATSAVVRLLVVDYARAADGTARSTTGVIDATLRWDETQGFWRLASWPGNDDPAALDALLANSKGFCHAAAG